MKISWKNIQATPEIHSIVVLIDNNNKFFQSIFLISIKSLKHIRTKDSCLITRLNFFDIEHVLVYRVT